MALSVQRGEWSWNGEKPARRLEAPSGKGVGDANEASTGYFGSVKASWA